MLAAALMLAVAPPAEPPPAPPPRSETVWRNATFAVRATVTHRCTISARGTDCRGAAGQPPVRRIDSTDGLTIIEF